jgi:tetratricopeptide (TPR) repeat protein
MSQLLPFSNAEIKAISDVLSKAGWVGRNTLGKGYRFFADKKERVVSLTIEHLIGSLMRGKGYLPLARVKFSILASIGMVKEDLLKKLFLYWSQKLKEITPIFEQLFLPEAIVQVPDEDDMYEAAKRDFIDRMPEADMEKDENAFYQRVRLALTHEKFTLDYVTCKQLSTAFQELGLQPTQSFNEIYELQDGLASTCIDQILVFKNPDYKEIIFMEPGYITYYRDIEVENVRARIFVDSYALEPLANTWKVDLVPMVQALIKNARSAFTECLNETGVAEFTKVYFVKKNLDLFLKTYLKAFNPLKDSEMQELVFPVPNAWYEILHSATLLPPVWNLFIKPPETFDELQARRVYIESQKQSKQGNFTEIIGALSATLATFNKAGQKYAFFLALVELARIAARVNNFAECKSKFEMALDFAIKSEGFIGSEEIIKVQEEYAEACVRFKELDSAIRQYTLLSNYLERARPETDSKRIDILLKLNTIFIGRPDSDSLDHEILGYFKIVKEFADRHKDKFVLASYHLVLGKYFEKRGKPSQAVDTFKKGMDIAHEAGSLDVELDCIISIGNIALYGKKKNIQGAQRYLERGNEIVGKTDDLFKELKIYEMLQDLYTQQDNMELAGHYNKESQRLRVALKARGLL